MAEVLVKIDNTPVRVAFGDDTAEAQRQQLLAAASAVTSANEADRSTTEADRSALMRDQAADLVLPQNIFLDILTTDPLVTALAEGTHFKIVDSASGIATVYVRTAGGADELYQERTASWFRNNEGIAVFGGSADDSLVWQAAHDEAEAAGLPLIHLPAGSTFNFNGTTEIGNVALKTNKCVWNFILDDGFTQRGTSARRTAGAMVTKSSTGAGHGLATVGIEYDELRIVATRTSTSSPLKTGLLLSNLHKLKGGAIDSYSTTSVAAGCGGIDFWGGMQGVDTGIIHYHRDNDFELEGFWLRNLSTGRVSRDWDIDGIIVSGSGQDEQVALFTAPGIVANLEDIHIGFIIGEIEAGGGGQIFSVLDNNGFDESRFKNITIGPIIAVVKGVNSAKADTFFVKFTYCAPRVASIDIEVTGSWGTVPILYGLRSITDAAQTRFPKIGSLRVALNYVQEYAATTANAISGTIVVDGKTVVDGSGSGWKNAISNVPELNNVQVADGKDDATKLFSANALTGCETIRGDVAGPIQNYRDFIGIHRWKYDKWGQRDWTTQLSTYNPRYTHYEAKVFVTGGTAADTIGRALNNASTGPKDIPVTLKITIDDPVGLTVLKSVLGTYGRLQKARIDRRVGNTMASSKHVELSTGGTLTIASDQVTPIAQIHTLDTEGALASDNLNKINGGDYDGQVQYFIAANAGRVITVKHNGGGGNIQTHGGADVPLSSTGLTKFTYLTSTGKWHTGA